MINGLNWERDGRDWPHREHSRFVQAAGLRWHVQVMGDGPVVLLLHGTGASSHSWRDAAALLADQFTVVIPDLPGHGFTGVPADASGFSLPAVAAGLTDLLRTLDLSPRLSVGHSAGAAVALRMTLDNPPGVSTVVSVNGALLPFPGLANDILGPAARFLASSALAAQAVTLFAGSQPSVERLLRSTGSGIGPEGKRLYARLVANAGHVHGALALMANWDLRPLVRDMPRLRSRLILVTGSNDRMVPSAEAYRVRALVPGAQIISLRGLGHLAHEERPDEIATLLERMGSDETAA